MAKKVVKELHERILTKKEEKEIVDLLKFNSKKKREKEIYKYKSEHSNLSNYLNLKRSSYENISPNLIEGLFN